MFRTAPAALLLCFCATLSPAAVWTGGGGDNLWSSAANWDTLSVPGSEAFAVFPASESTTAVTLDASATIAGIAATNSVSLSGEALHLTAPEPVRAASGVTLNFSNPVSLTADAATLSAHGATLVISSNVCTAAGPVSASIRTLSVRDGALLTPELTLFGNANYYAWQPTLSVQGTAPNGLTGRLVSGMNLLDGGQGWNLSIDGGSETLGALSFGFAAPHAVNLTGGAALEVAALRAQPGGLLRLSLADGASLRPLNSANQGDIFAPWLFLNGSSGLSLTRINESGVLDASVPWQSSPGSDTPDGSPWQISHSAVTQTVNHTVSALRLYGQSSLELGGHDLTIRQGAILFDSYNPKRIRADLGGTLRFGGKDLICPVAADTIVSAPIEHTPEEAQSQPPSILLPQFWGSFCLSGEDRVGQWYGIFLQDANCTFELSGPSDRTFTGPIVGKCFFRKTGTGTLRFEGPRYTSDGGLYYALTIAGGRVVSANNSCFYGIKLEEGEFLIDCVTNQCEINRSSGTVLGGIGRLREPRTNNGISFDGTQTLALGFDDRIGTLMLSTSGYRTVSLQNGATIRATISPEAVSCLRVAAYSGWGYTAFPGSSGTVRLLLDPSPAELRYRPADEFVFARFEQYEPSGTDCNWVIETSRPDLLDVSQATVVYRNKTFTVTGLRTGSVPTYIILH